MAWTTAAAGEAGGATLIVFGFEQEGVGEAADFRRHGGGEEQRLADLRQQADDALDIGDEAHVQHAVGLVDDEDLHIAQQDLAALEEIEQPARGGDQHVDAAVELLQLLDEGFAADQQRLAQLVILAVGVEVLGDLRGELARRLQDQRARHAGPGPAAGQDVDHRQGEGGGLARACLGRTQHVASHEDMGNCLRLNGSRLDIADFLDRTQHFRAQPEISKSHQCFLKSDRRIFTEAGRNAPRKIAADHRSG